MKKILNSVILAALLAACTDYVAQIDEREGEWLTSDVPHSSSSKGGNSSSSEAWLLSADQSYIIYSNGQVTDTQGSLIGIFDFVSGTITGVDGAVIITGVDINQLPKFDPDVTTGTMTDSRDGQTYKTVSIGTQTWMAQNLNYEIANSYCYKDSASYCTKYGRLYTWAAATTACPDGWHLPTQAEWNTLFTAVGGPSTAGKVLKSTSGWYSSGNGSDAYSFSALPAGYYRYDNGLYDGGGYSAGFWISTENGSVVSAYGMYLDCGNDHASLGNYYVVDGLSVRCLKDK